MRTTSANPPITVPFCPCGPLISPPARDITGKAYRGGGADGACVTQGYSCCNGFASDGGMGGGSVSPSSSEEVGRALKGSASFNAHAPVSLWLCSKDVFVLPVSCSLVANHGEIST